MTFRRILVPSFSRSSSSSLGRLDFEDEGTTIPKKKKLLCRKVIYAVGMNSKVSELATYRRPLTVLALVRSRASPCMFFAGQSNGFGGLGVACWPLVPKFAGSNPAEAVGFLE